MQRKGGLCYLCARRQYPKTTLDSREVAEIIVMISRIGESYLACATKAARPACSSRMLLRRLSTGLLLFEPLLVCDMH